MAWGFDMEHPSPSLQIYGGDSLERLRSLPDSSFDALITDPPYSSGGASAGDRARDPAQKYVQHGQTKQWPTFGGDQRDQRGYAHWSHLWLSECYRILKPGAYALVFCDWRQLPLMTDILQGADFVWRGVISWDKGPGARAPHKGYFRHQCEYVVWGSKGALPVATHAGPYLGCIRATVKRSDKFHLTGKPTELMRELVRIVPPGGRIVDPFAGSCTTGVACALEDRECLLIEREEINREIGHGRIVDALRERRAFLA
jgi:site-specific DNA-methyltransferase (adenine-specific)